MSGELGKTRSRFREIVQIDIIAQRGADQMLTGVPPIMEGKLSVSMDGTMETVASSATTGENA